MGDGYFLHIESDKRKEEIKWDSGEREIQMKSGFENVGWKNILGTITLLDRSANKYTHTKILISNKHSKRPSTYVSN